MKIINPTENKLEMQFEGTTYTVEADDSTEVSEKVATHWKENVHSFIVVETDEVKVAPKVEDKKEDVIEDEDIVSEKDMKAIDEAIARDKKAVKKTNKK